MLPRIDRQTIVSARALATRTLRTDDSVATKGRIGAALS